MIKPGSRLKMDLKTGGSTAQKVVHYIPVTSRMSGVLVIDGKLKSSQGVDLVQADREARIKKLISCGAVALVQPLLLKGRRAQNKSVDHM
ncbi:MAG: hypothetical protein HQM16_07710 [Deltaproteobacteria bacterium]|nr:hypothetical protein [Deltaproteobacteria bacterium]